MKSEQQVAPRFVMTKKPPKQEISDEEFRRRLNMSWTKKGDRNEVLQYYSELQTFLLDNLWEEAVLIAAYPVSHNRL